VGASARFVAFTPHGTITRSFQPLLIRVPSKSLTLPHGRATEQGPAQLSSPRVSKGCASTQSLTGLWRNPTPDRPVWLRHDIYYTIVISLVQDKRP